MRGVEVAHPARVEPLRGWGFDILWRQRVFRLTRSAQCIAPLHCSDKDLRKHEIAKPFQWHRSVSDNVPPNPVAPDYTAST
jgi:hypothetical protein